jgi:hypothetical protein
MLGTWREVNSFPKYILKLQLLSFPGFGAFYFGGIYNLSPLPSLQK